MVDDVRADNIALTDNGRVLFDYLIVHDDILWSERNGKKHHFKSGVFGVKLPKDIMDKIDKFLMNMTLMNC